MSKDWLSEGKKVDLQFKACSGSRLANMCNEPYRQGIQMDITTRPKVVLMEAGGNNADFYPISRVCIFQQDGAKLQFYEDDTDGRGPCKSSLSNTQAKNGGSGLKDQFINTINAWRGHPQVFGNEASLYLLGYGTFSADGNDRNDSTFFWNHPQQMLTKQQRQDS